MARVLVFGLLLGGRGISSPPNLPNCDGEHVEIGEGLLLLKLKF